MFRYWFDDWVKNDASGDWAYLCEECRKEFGWHVKEHSVVQNTVCGVRDCNNQAEWFLEFDGHKFEIEEPDKWPWHIVIKYGGAEFISVHIPAWSTRDTLETARERPENKEQMELLLTLVCCANNYIEERYG